MIGGFQWLDVIGYFAKFRPVQAKQGVKFSLEIAALYIKRRVGSFALSCSIEY